MPPNTFLIPLIVLLLAAGAAAFADAPKPFSVADFGAKPDDGKDDTAAAQAAIDRCRERPGATLLFPPGRYDFHAGAINNPRHREVSLRFEKCRDLTVAAKGATWVFHGLTHPTLWHGCDGVQIEGVSIDWDRPPFSQGRVLSVASKSFQVDIEPQFPVTGDEPIEAFMEYDPKTRRPAHGGREAYHAVKAVKLVRPQVLEVTLGRRPRIRKGMLLVLRHQVYRFNAFSFRECRDVVIRDVTVYTCPGMGIAANQSHNFDIRKLRVMNRPGSTRMMSATADATHFNSCSGRIRLEDCLFEGMGDDATNVHSMFLRVTKRADEKTVLAVVRNNWFSPPTVGEVLEFTDAKTALPYAEGTVATVRINRKERNHRITFEQPLPQRLKVGDMLGNASRTPKLIVRNCIVRHNRARGFLIQTRDALIEKNTFTGCTAAAIHVTCDVGYWTEAIGTRKVVIRDNTLTDTNFGVASSEGAINVFAHLPGWRHAPAGVHRDLRIEGNTIDGTGNAAIAVGATDGAILRSNVIRDWGRRQMKRGSDAAVYLHRSRNITLEGNTYVPGESDKRIEIGKDLDKATLVVKDAPAK